MTRPNKVLIAWLVVYALLGMLSGVTHLSDKDAQVSNLMAGIPTSVLIYLWCKADAFDRQILVPSGYTMFATLFAPLGIPVYLVKTRTPLRAAAVGMVKSLGFFVGASVLMAVVEAAAQAVIG
jgi:predicted permease